MIKNLVSAIIPVYNGEKYLAEAIESVLRQSYKPFEIIVIDDGSTDKTSTIAQSYPQVRYFYQINQGHGEAKNTGIHQAKGEYLAFLDADDIWMPDKLFQQVTYLENNPKVGYTICHMVNFQDGVDKFPSWAIITSSQDSKIPAYITSALVVRKTVMEEVGYFDTKYKHGNDSDWFFRANHLGIKMNIIPDILFRRRIHSSNLSYQTKEMKQELFQIIRASIARKRIQNKIYDQN
ncbi:glycosyltransferase family A protein [Geminocystis sp. NIES-3709]|uniref:glycosyltransferase family 2 protein n=1 Tax=Geminocystis sp. NIES-3709 TaxID=1617448 RepID=UPI0005FCCE96|nr:glycosyltransferase family A protein [Geminocystis sp. NIES-3709]BAQ64672.1 beta-1,3-glucosyltransferase [Geminocystis sp. NIES-3709]